MSFDPQPLDRRRRRRHHVLRHEPADPARSCRASTTKSAPFSDFGLKAYGDVLFASQAYVEANRDLLVAYFAGLLAGVEANVADPKAVHPAAHRRRTARTPRSTSTYSEAGNPAYIALLDSDYTEANGLLHDRPGVPRERGLPELRGSRRDRPAARRPSSSTPRSWPTPTRLTADEDHRGRPAGPRLPQDRTRRWRATSPSCASRPTPGSSGWGEASTNWGHMLPDGVRRRGPRRVRRAAARHRPDRRARPAAPAARDARRLPRLGGAHQPGRSARSRSPAGTSSARRSDCRCTACSAPPTGRCACTAPARRCSRRRPTTTPTTSTRRSAHGFGGFKVRLGRTRRRRRRHRRRRPRPRRPRRVHRRRLVLVPRRPHGARGRRARCAPLDIGFFEEPVPQMRVDDLAWLAARSPIPIAVGERVYSPGQFDDLARRGAANVFQPDASICGGMLACMEIAAAARQRGIAVYPHVGGPTIIGLAANLHWAVAADVAWMEYDIDPYQPLVTELGGRDRARRHRRRRARRRPTAPGSASPCPTTSPSASRTSPATPTPRCSPTTRTGGRRRERDDAGDVRADVINGLRDRGLRKVFPLAPPAARRHRARRPRRRRPAA